MSAPSERTRIRRNAFRAEYDQQTILEILQSHSLCTVAYVAQDEVAVSVLLVDGIVVARSGFHCSMNYRSVSLFGAGQVVEGEAKAEALDLFVETLIPGHNEHARPPTSAETAATSVVCIPLGEMSAKIRAGDPDDPTDLCPVMTLKRVFRCPIILTM
jgi:nitroimidazol reductase NimA-like FMN-containing flavoprotein (pyridoxamine 5'-phosphate oxidase superfamily)